MAGLLVGACFSLIGFSVFLYGKKAGAFKPTLIGMALMVYPYLVRSPLWNTVIGVGLLVWLWWPA